MYNNDEIQIFNLLISKSSFKKFLDENVKAEDYNFEAYIDDLEKQYGETGLAQYELSSSESKSGNTEIYELDIRGVVEDE